MVLVTYNDVKAYLRQIAHEHRGIQGFESGNFDRLMHYFGQRRVKTPIMFAEWPTLGMEDFNDQTEGIFSFGLYILKAVPKTNYEDQDDAINDCTEIARDIMTRFILDQEENSLIVRLNFQIEPVTFMTIDNCFGAKFDIELGDHTGFVYDPAKWNS